MRELAVPRRSGPTPVDRGFQLAYLCAYRVMRVYWAVRHPTTEGSLVALWNGGEILLIRNSYVDYHSLPGGYLRRNESALDAALRELAEEVGVTAEPESLELAFDETNEWVGKQDHVRIFTLDVPTRPEVDVDYREVVDARWWRPEDALSLSLFPPVRRVIERRRGPLAGE